MRSRLPDRLPARQLGVEGRCLNAQRAQQKNFEAKLREALQFFMAGEVADIGRADYAFVTDASSLAQALRRGTYTHVVYYGHAVDDGATLKPLKEIGVAQMTDALSGTNVSTLTS